MKNREDRYSFEVPFNLFHYLIRYAPQHYFQIKNTLQPPLEPFVLKKKVNKVDYLYLRNQEDNMVSSTASLSRYATNSLNALKNDNHPIILNLLKRKFPELMTAILYDESLAREILRTYEQIPLKEWYWLPRLGPNQLNFSVFTPLDLVLGKEHINLDLLAELLRKSDAIPLEPVYLIDYILGAECLNIRVVEILLERINAQPDDVLALIKRYPDESSTVNECIQLLVEKEPLILMNKPEAIWESLKGLMLLNSPLLTVLIECGLTYNFSILEKYANELCLPSFRYLLLSGRRDSENQVQMQNLKLDAVHQNIWSAAHFLHNTGSINLINLLSAQALDPCTVYLYIEKRLNDEMQSLNLDNQATFQDFSNTLKLIVIFKKTLLPEDKTSLLNQLESIQLGLPVFFERIDQVRISRQLLAEIDSSLAKLFYATFSCNAFGLTSAGMNLAQFLQRQKSEKTNYKNTLFFSVG